jgi:hypothetical protein
MQLFVEPYQAAFYLLMPEHWRTEGGMRPSGVAWNKLDLVESNIGFRATSPDGQSRFGWYPRFYFIDPAVYARSSGGILHPAVGSVMDGAWVYPAMGVADFARNIVFQQLARKDSVEPVWLGDLWKCRRYANWRPRSPARLRLAMSISSWRKAANRCAVASTPRCLSWGIPACGPISAPLPGSRLPVGCARIVG